MERFTNTELADMNLIYELAEGNAKAAERLYYEKHPQNEVHRTAGFLQIYIITCVNMDYYEVIGIVRVGRELLELPALNKMC